MNKVFRFFWFGILSASILSNPMLGYPGRDSGIFLYIGSLILKGKLPYVDAWENKGPLIFYLNALGLAIGGGSRWGVWFIEFLFLVASCSLGYIMLKKLLGEIPALLGIFVFVITAGQVLQGGNFSEEYSLLFSIIAIFFFLSSLRRAEQRSDPNNKESASSGYRLPCNDEFMIGITLGFNILSRPNNISVQAAICGAYFILTLFSKDWQLLIARAIQILSGMLVVLVPVLLYFAARHGLTEMINVVIVFNAQYSAGGGIGRVLEGASDAINGIGLFWVGLAIVGYMLAVINLLRQKNLNSPLGSFLLVLLLGLPAEAVLSTVSGKNYPHYFIGWSVYVGLLSSYAVFLLVAQLEHWARINADQRGWVVVLLLILLTVFTKFETWKNYGVAISSLTTRHAPLDYRDSVVDYIQKNTAPTDKVLVWGFRPIINFTAGRESPAAYLPYPLSHVDTPLAQHWAERFYEQLTANPPVLIINMIEPADRERIPDLDPKIRQQQKIKWKDVVLAYNYKEVLKFISEYYVRVATINGSAIYRLTQP